MQKEIISKNGYCIECVEDPTDFYTDIEEFHNGLFEAINIEFEDPNESDIKLLFGRNLEYSEKKSYDEIDLAHTTFEIAICSITNELIYVFGVPFFDIWSNLKENIVKKFKNFNEFIQWLIPLIFYKEISTDKLTYFNHIYSKQNKKILSLLEDKTEDILKFIKHKHKFMRDHLLSNDEYEYFLTHENVVVNREYTSPWPSPILVFDNDGKTLIKFKDYLEREHLTPEQYWSASI